MTRKSLPKAEPAPFFSAIDKITVAFCCWILAYMLLGLAMGRKVVEPQMHLPAYLSILTLVFLMAWAEKQLARKEYPTFTKVLRFLRSIYPVLFFGYFYTSGYAVNRILFGDWQDPFFLRIDEQIFGYLPSLVWGQKYGQWLLQELFHLAYFCYYPMIVGLPVYLYFKNKRGFEELIFALTFVFYLCYFIYSLLPVIGGRYIPEAMALTKVYHAGPFTHIMALIYNYTRHLGGAFPSSHIGITLVLTIAGLRYVRPWGYLFCVIAFFLTIATVFCHYHWFIDAVGGVFIGILGYWLAQGLRAKLQREPL